MTFNDKIFIYLFISGSRDKKLIPVLIEDCKIPEILSHITCCNYTRKELLVWFWKRLVSSLKAPLNPSECRSENQAKLNMLNLDTSTSVPGWSRAGSNTGSSSVSSMGSSSMSSMGSSSLGTSGSSSMDTSSYSSESSSASSSDTRSNDYIQPTATYPPYLELLSASPPLPRRSNDYERISNVRRAPGGGNADSNIDDRSSHYTQPITSQDRSQSPSNPVTRGYQTLQTTGSVQGHVQQNLSPQVPSSVNQSSHNRSPVVYRRPVPPIPTQNTRNQNEGTEYFC